MPRKRNKKTASITIRRMPPPMHKGVGQLNLTQPWLILFPVDIDLKTSVRNIRLNVEPEQQDVPVLNDIVLAFLTHLSRILGGLLTAQIHEGFVGDSL